MTVNYFSINIFFRSDDDAYNKGNVLYVHGLSSQTRSEDVKRKFEDVGQVLDVTVITDPRTKTHRGFCFVTMATIEQANAAIDKFNGTTLDGSKLIVEKVRVTLHVVVVCLTGWCINRCHCVSLLFIYLNKMSSTHSIIYKHHTTTSYSTFNNIHFKSTKSPTFNNRQNVQNPEIKHQEDI